MTTDARVRALHPTQEKALHLFVAGTPLARIAKATATSERTLRRWRRMPAFVAAVNERRREALHAIAEQVAMGAAEGVALMRKLLADDGVPVGVRLAAAKALLDAHPRHVELTNFESRLGALEGAR